MISSPRSAPTSVARSVARWALGGFLLVAGVGHLTIRRTEFLAQVPGWLPLNAEFVVLASGVVEILLGMALILRLPSRVLIGVMVAAFFVAVFPGNISQYVTGTDAFGLDTDRSRLIRLLFQPLLVLWALWSTGVWPFRPKPSPDR